MTKLYIEKIKSCDECPHSHSIEWENRITYYCGKMKSGNKIDIKAIIPKWCPLRKFDLIKKEG